MPYHSTTYGSYHQEYDAERAKKLQADKYIDNRELERVKRTQKQEAEWEARARAQENEEATKHTMEKKEYDAERAKRLAKDSYIESNELLKVKRKQKQEQEYEDRLRAVERQQDIIKNQEKKEYDRERKKRWAGEVVTF